MAARHWVGGNAIWDGTAGTKWSLTAGGSGGQAVPTASDDVFLDNGTGTGNVTTATSATICTCKSIDCTGYVGILTVNGTILVAGNITLVSGMTITTSTGTPILQPTASGTLTSNTKTWPYQLQLAPIAVSQTFTLADDWTVTGAVSHATNAATINGHNIFFSGNLSGSTLAGGSTVYVFKGTSQWLTGALFKNDITFNTVGTIILGAAISFQGNMIWTSGTITTTSNTLTITGTSNLNVSSISWNNFTVSTATVTLSADLNIGALFTSTGVNTVNGLFNINTTSLTVGSTSIAGTSTVVMNNTGTWSGAGTLNNNLTFNASGKTITVATSTNYATGIMTYTAGTVNHSGTITFGASCTINTNGIIWVNVSMITTGVTYTINSLFSISGTLTITGTTIIFAGTSGFTCATLTGAGAGRTFTLQSGVTYTITTAITFTSATALFPTTFQSSSGSIQAILNLNYGASQDLDFINAIRINSSLGQPIYSYAGILTTATNWINLTAPMTIGAGF